MKPVNYPVCTPNLTGRESELVLDCINSGWVSSDGPYVKEFEDKFSKYIGVDSGVAVSNGTAALVAAFYAIGLKEGDEVIMPSFTIISCAIAVIRFGAIPVFVDIEPKTWNINVKEIQAKISNKTKAILAVHMYGHPCMMDEINSIASEYGLTVVEDASQVHGATYKGRKCGNLAHISTFSFYANKIITTGEGGMVLSNNQDYIDRAKQYRNLCMLTSRRFYHDELGDNLRMTNLQAAVGIAQLERVEEFIERKRDLGQLYARKLASISKEIQLQSEMPWANMVYWMYCIQLSDEIQQNNYDIINQLQNHGIGARPFFVGMHQQPALRGLTTTHGVSLPVTEKASMKGLYLPSSVTLVESDIDYIVYELDNILKNKR